MKRILTQLEETAIHFCHHDLVGFTTDEAAKILGLSQRRVQQLLQSAEQKAPQLFPLLTRHQAAIKWLINEAGLTFEQVAGVLEISVNSVSNVVKTLKEKGVHIERRKKTAQYQNYMDGQIREKF